MGIIDVDGFCDGMIETKELDIMVGHEVACSIRGDGVVVRDVTCKSEDSVVGMSVDSAMGSKLVRCVGVNVDISV